MNLYRLLCQRATERKPLRLALIGAGKFGTMFLSQARHTRGLHVVAVGDLKTIEAPIKALNIGPVEVWSADGVRLR